MFKNPYIHELKSFDAGNGKGILTFAEEFKDLPFGFSRFFFTYNVKESNTRGGHAHKFIHQALIAVSGNFKVTCEDVNSNITNFHLNRPNMCLIVPPSFWCIQTNFSSDAVCLVLSDGLYDESEYIRNKEDFIALR